MAWWDQGLAAAGESLSRFAAVAGVEAIRADAEERRLALAAEIAAGGDARRHGYAMEQESARQKFQQPAQEASIEASKAQAEQSRTATGIAKAKEGRTTAAIASLGGVNIPESYEKAIARAETGNKGMVANELGSGAYGTYQFMPATWKDVRANNPELNLPEDMRQATPEQHKAAFKSFTARNAETLKQAGIEPTPANLYLAHRFGAGGAMKVAQADENARLADILPPEWQAQNPDMRGQTVGSFKRLAEERMKGVTMEGGAGAPGTMPPDVQRTYNALVSAGDIDKAAELQLRWATAEKKTKDMWTPLPEEAGKRLLGAGYDRTKAYQINLTSGEIKPIGGSGITIDQRGESAAQKVQVEAASKTHAELQEAAKQARGALGQIARMEELANQTNVGGKFSATFLEIKKTAQALGIDIGDKEIGAEEAFDALSKQWALQMRNPAGGAGMPGAMSDADREYLARTIPSLGTTPEGRKLMLQMMRAVYQRTLEETKIANDYIRSKDFATDPSGLYAKLQEYADANPLFATNGPQGGAEGDVSGFGSGGGPAGAAGTPRIADEAGWRALKPGTLYMAPDGTLRTKR